MVHALRGRRRARDEGTSCHDGFPETAAPRHDLFHGLFLNDHGRNEDEVRILNRFVSQLLDIHVDQRDGEAVGDHGRDCQQAERWKVRLLASEFQAASEAPKSFRHPGINHQDLVQRRLPSRQF